MDIRHLQYFIEVAKQRSFTKAAQALFITQPTISKMVRNIEDELGVELFDRKLRKMELTDAGRIIFEQAQDIVNAFENLSTELNDLMNLKKGRVTIGMPPMVGSSFFPLIIEKFHEEYPGIKVQLVEDGAKSIEKGVENGSLDIGVTLLPPAKHDIFHIFSFVHEELMLVVYPQHRLAGRDACSLCELSEEAFVSFRDDFSLHDRIISACRLAGFEPQIASQSSQWDFIVEMVAAKLGVALLPAPICQELASERFKVIPLARPGIPWHLGMIWRKDRYMSFAAREWLKFTKDLLNA